MNDLLVRLYEFKDECIKLIDYDYIDDFLYGRLDMVNEIITIIENELIEGEENASKSN